MRSHSYQVGVHWSCPSRDFQWHNSICWKGLVSIKGGVDVVIPCLWCRLYYDMFSLDKFLEWTMNNFTLLAVVLFILVKEYNMKLFAVVVLALKSIFDFAFSSCWRSKNKVGEWRGWKHPLLASINSVSLYGCTKCLTRKLVSLILAWKSSFHFFLILIIF